MISKIFIREPIKEVGIDLKGNKITLETENSKFVLEINYLSSFENLISTIKLVEW